MNKLNALITSSYPNHGLCAELSDRLRKLCEDCEVTILTMMDNVEVPKTFKLGDMDLAFCIIDTTTGAGLESFTRLFYYLSFPKHCPIVTVCVGAERTLYGAIDFNCEDLELEILLNALRLRKHGVCI